LRAGPIACRCHSDGAQLRDQLISNATVYSWHPRWVKVCLSDYVRNASGVPQIVADLSRRQLGSLAPVAAVSLRLIAWYRGD
jgi:hypothetical protein